MLELLLVLTLGFALLVALPLLLLKVFFELVVFVVLLPFKLIGLVFHVLAGGVKLVLGLGAAVLGLVIGLPLLLVVGIPLLLVLVPLALLAIPIVILFKGLAVIAC